jgi:hypothetical protein
MPAEQKVAALKVARAALHRCNIAANPNLPEVALLWKELHALYISQRRGISHLLASRLKAACNTPVEESAAELAETKFLDLGSYDSEMFLKLIKTEDWKKVEFALRGTSKPLTLFDDLAWDQTYQKFVYGPSHPDVIDSTLLKEINRSLRPCSQFDIRAGQIRDQVGIEVLDEEYLPTKEVKQALYEFLLWLNANIKLCDTSQVNPIVLAGTAFQRFISIHPFEKANEMTGKVLVDIILRRYGLLPATWGDENLAIFSYKEPNEQATPTMAVLAVIIGLEKTYQMVKISS